MDIQGIETYQVGFFRDLRHLRWDLRHQSPRKAVKRFWYWFSRSFTRRSYWNGYLAEWHYCPEGVRHTKCGHGWTKRAALRRLGKHIVQSNLILKGQ